jgi:hypothetical protein
MFQKPLFPKTGKIVWILCLTILVVFFLLWTQGFTDLFYKQFFTIWEGRTKTKNVAKKVQALLGEKTKDELHKLFRSFDIDRDGDVSVAEFVTACDHMELFLTNKECVHLMHRFDSDKTGNIDYKEFIRFAHGHEGLPTPPQSPRTLARLNRTKIVPVQTLVEEVSQKLTLPPLETKPWNENTGWLEEQREEFEASLLCKRLDEESELTGLTGMAHDRKYEMVPALPAPLPPRTTVLPALDSPAPEVMEQLSPAMPFYAPLEL